MKKAIFKMDGSSEDSELRLILQEQNMRRRHLTELPLSNNESVDLSFIKQMNHFYLLIVKCNYNLYE
jgi:hypothetical protein